MMRLCKAHKTDVLSMTIMGETVVILNTYDLIKEYFQKRTYLTDRPHGTSIFRIVDKSYEGETMSSGVWPKSVSTMQASFIPTKIERPVEKPKIYTSIYKNALWNSWAMYSTQKSLESETWFKNRVPHSRKLCSSFFHQLIYPTSVVRYASSIFFRTSSKHLGTIAGNHTTKQPTKR